MAGDEAGEKLCCCVCVSALRRALIPMDGLSTIGVGSGSAGTQVRETQVRVTYLPWAGVSWLPQALPLPTRQAPHMHQAGLILSGGLNRHLVGGLYALSHHMRTARGKRTICLEHAPGGQPGRNRYRSACLGKKRHDFPDLDNLRGGAPNM